MGTLNFLKLQKATNWKVLSLRQNFSYEKYFK